MNPRKLLMILGLALLLVGGVQAWRAAHPPLSPEEQIRANVEDLAQAIQSHSPRAVLGFLAPDFSWNGMKKEELKSQMNGMAFWTDVHLAITNEQVSVQGDHATATGRFTISLRQSPGAEVTTQSGNFQLQWRKNGRNWEVVQAQGGEG